MANYWLKLYHEMLDDPKMGMMSDRMYRRTIECFLLAGEADDDGWLPSLDHVAWRLRLSPEEVEADLVELARQGILDQRDGKWMVVNFAERQAPADAAERMKRMRDRRKKEEYYAPVTKRNTELELESELEPELELNSSTTTGEIEKNSGAFKCAISLGESLGKDNPENWAYKGFQNGWIWEYAEMQAWKSRNYEIEQ